MVLNSDELAAVRSHLANERTLLAYGRAALGLTAAGLGVLGFRDTRLPASVGWALIAAAAVVVLIGVLRFRHVRVLIGAPHA